MDLKPPLIKWMAKLPPGVMPQNAQTIVIVVLAAVMSIVIAFSGSRGSAKPAENIPKRQEPAFGPDVPRVEIYKKEIENLHKKLEEERRRAGLETEMPPSMLTRNSYGSGSYGQSYSPIPQPAPRSWIEEDREKRNYLSLYSPTVVSSRRDQTPFPYAGPDEKEARKRTDEKKKGDLGDAVGPKHTLFEGTIIETVLANRLDGTFSGPVNCMTTQDIYSQNGRHVLIPAGSRVIGEAKHVEGLGQVRLALGYHRLIMPDGYSVSLDKFKGLNQVGETGLRDQVNNHYLQAFGASIAIGALAGLAQSNTRATGDVSGIDVYRQGVATSLSQSSLRILERFLNVLPTVTIREGQRVKIYLSDDLLLPAYENHRMPEDL